MHPTRCSEIVQVACQMGKLSSWHSANEQQGGAHMQTHLGLRLALARLMRWARVPVLEALATLDRPSTAAGRSAALSAWSDPMAMRSSLTEQSTTWALTGRARPCTSEKHVSRYVIPQQATSQCGHPPTNWRIT